MKEKMIQNLLAAILGNKVSKDDWNSIMGALDKEINKKVAVIGQSGVGKSTTLNAVFGLNNYVSDVAEGTAKIEEKVFPMRDGSNLSIYDMPGLNCDVDKDIENEEMYKKILPGCDVIVYIINAHSCDFGKDCKILKEIVMPICNTNNLKDNFILAFNKIDTIGEMQDPNDEELKWNIINNVPTEKLKEAIKIKLSDFVTKLIDEKIIDDADSIKAEQVVFYSALSNYNLGDFLMAITKAGKRGRIWDGHSLSLKTIGTWSDKKLEIENGTDLE